MGTQIRAEATLSFDFDGICFRRPAVHGVFVVFLRRPAVVILLKGLS